jgi:hypothetical protein
MSWAAPMTRLLSSQVSLLPRLVQILRNSVELLCLWNAVCMVWPSLEIKITTSIWFASFLLVTDWNLQMKCTIWHTYCWCNFEWVQDHVVHPVSQIFTLGCSMLCDTSEFAVRCTVWVQFWIHAWCYWCWRTQEDGCILSHCDRKGMLLVLAHVKMVHPGPHGEDPLCLSWSPHTVLLSWLGCPSKGCTEHSYFWWTFSKILSLVDITFSKVSKRHQ